MHGPGAEAGGEKVRVWEVEGEEAEGLEREMGRGERRVVQARRGRVAARVRVVGRRKRRVGRCIVVVLCCCVGLDVACLTRGGGRGLV